MDFWTLQAQIRASRQITVKSDGATFTLELPSDYAWRTMIEANRNDAGRMLFARATHAVLSVAMTGWEGVTARYLFVDAPADPLPFSPEARAELLEERADIADALMTEISAKLAERRERRDAARKN